MESPKPNPGWVTAFPNLASLEESRVTIEREREEISTYKAQVAELKQALEAKQERLDER